MLCVCLCLFGASCGGGRQQETSYSRDFLGKLSPEEFMFYVIETFYTLLPHLDSPAELGISNLKYNVGGTGEIYDGFEYDTLRETNGSYDIVLKSLPVFYGLLKTAEQYEAYMGIDNSEVAARHGKQHAIKATSVEAALHNLMCKPSLLTHGSADGAEYVDGYYVYDELVNPYQQWLDQGWELQFIPIWTEAEQPHYCLLYTSAAPLQLGGGDVTLRLLHSHVVRSGRDDIRPIWGEDSSTGRPVLPL